MSQRDRQWATVIIWGVFMVLMGIILSQLLLFRADFAGLYPPQTLNVIAQFGMPSQTLEELQQALAFAQNAREGVMENVRLSIQGQMAQRLPIAAVLTLLLTLAATISTWFVWRNAGLEAHLALRMLDIEKAKRRSRIDTFVEDLRESELVELRARLIKDDGEAKPLGALLQGDDTAQAQDFDISSQAMANKRR
jgi:hypothetical protein